MVGMRWLTVHDFAMSGLIAAVAVMAEIRWLRWVRCMVLIVGGCWAMMPCYAGDDSSQVQAGMVGLCDLSHGRPWIAPPVAEVSPAIKSKMDAFSKAWAIAESHPHGRGVTAKDLESVMSAWDALGLRRGDDGKVMATKPFHWAMGENEKQAKAGNGKTNFAEAVYPVLNQLRKVYESCQTGSIDALKIEESIKMILDLLADQDWGALQPGYGVLGINDYRFRALKPVNDFVSLSHLLADADRRVRIAENLWWMCEGPQLLVEKPWLKTDTYLNNFGQCCTAIAALPSGPAKWQRISMIRRAMDQSVLAYQPNLIMPDGGVVHHGGYHADYAGYSFGAVVSAFELMEQCGISSNVSDEIIQRMVLSGRQWAWVHAGDQLIPNLYLRVRLPSAASARPAAGNGSINFALDAARLRQVAGGLARQDDQDLAGLCLALAPTKVPADLQSAWAAKSFKALPPSGHLSLLSAGAAVHRRDHWAVVIRGQSQYLRGGEGMPYGAWGQAITYGGRFCRGSLMIIDCGTPTNIADSGYVAEGFDYSRVPGTTGPVTGPEDAVSGYIETKATQGGGCDLDGQGLWAWAEHGIAKSAFLVDGRITHLTTGAKAPTDAKFMTTVMQSAEPTPMSLIVDGQAVAESGVLRLSGAQAHTVFDARKRGYLIHAGGDDLEISRANQTWTYCEIPYFKSDQPHINIVQSVRCYVFDQREVAQPADMRKGQSIPGEITGPAKLAYFTPTRHRYTTAGFLHHPTTSSSQAHAFTVLPNTTTAALDQFAADMKSTKPPVRMLVGDGYHGFVDGPTGLRGWCLFKAMALPASEQGGIVCKVSRPCTLLEQRSGDQLRLAIASTDIAVKNAYQVELSGHWALDHSVGGASVQIHPQTTSLTIPFHYMSVEHVGLTRVEP